CGFSLSAAWRASARRPRGAGACPRGPRRGGPRQARPGCGESGPLLSHHLHGDLATPGSVELGEDHRPEASERELAVAEPDGDVPAEQRRPQMGVRVATLAVRETRIVVPVATALGDQALDQALQIVDERALELIDEERARGVQRVDEGDAVADRKLLDRFPDE